MLGLESPTRTHHPSVGKEIIIQRRLNTIWVVLTRKKGKVRLLGGKPTVFTTVAREKGVEIKRI